jgi:uncharacterized protein (UPF0303 family)
MLESGSIKSTAAISTIPANIASVYILREANFAAGKRNAVLASGHSSLLTLAEACEGNIPDALLKEDEVIIPVGGAFPVFVDGVHAATIAVSGLHEGKDHEIIVRALAEYLNIDLPAYKGYLV